MRRVIAAAAIFAAIGGVAEAAPAKIEVKIGPALQKEATRNYGEAEVARLAQALRIEVARQLDLTGVLEGAVIELTLVDARPNRPTMKQLRDTPGLSFKTHGVGGARIEGRTIAVDGAITPIAYQWYETDVRDTAFRSTWGDANTAIYRLAGRLSRGEPLSPR